MLSKSSILQFNFWKTYLFREIPGNMTVPNSTAEQTDKSERYLFTLLNNYKDFKIKINHAYYLIIYIILIFQSKLIFL